MRGVLVRGLIALVLAGAGISAARVAVAEPPRVSVELVGEAVSVPPGGTVWVALRQRIAPGWHTYWINPGDSGEPARVEWMLPPGFTAGEIAWPYPERIPAGPAMSYGYSNEVALPIPITAPTDVAPGTSVTLRGRLSWLVCEKICIPEEAPFALTVAVGPSRPDPAGAPVVAAARRAVPAESPWPSSYVATPDAVRLSVAAPGLAPERVAEVWFYPARWGAIEHAAPQHSRVDASGITIEVARGQLAEAVTAPIDGVLVVAERLGDGVARQAFAVRAAPRAAAAPMALAQALALAFAGGLVLNLMPCVLPVLSVKALALVRHAPARGHGLAYAAGVLASFAVVAGALLAFRAAGEQIGWGFQLQSPVFVALLAFVLFALALAMSGLLVVGGRFAGVGQALVARGGHAGAFFTGALVTVAATPCTAPFMGAAVGYAVTQPWTTALLVFEALALGLAMPYLLLTLVPAWRRFLPRPGPWMERLQQLLAFPLYASVAWLVWVVSQQVDPRGLAAVLAGLVLIAFAAWLHRVSSGVGAAWRRAGAIGAAGLVAGAVALAALASPGGRPAAPAERGVGWEPFSPARLAELRAQGRPVFVNVTAAWCITCLVNERVALRSAAVADVFVRKGVATLKADWTNRDPVITRMLGSFGRSGVPLYLLYPPGATGRAATGAPTVLPQILSEGAVVDAAERI